MLVKNFSDLEIYQLALQSAADVAVLVKKIPYYWNVEEVGQILSSSSSVHSNIAEGFAQRFYPKQFIRYLYIALGSSDESGNHLCKLKKDEIINYLEADEHIKRYRNISVKITNFISYLRKRYKIDTIPN